MGYRKDTIRGVSWMVGLRGVTRIIAYIKLAVLARLLGPKEFGVFGIASLVLAFLEIFTETGINALLVQEKKQIEEYIDTAFVVSVIRGFIISVLLLLLSKPVSSFFNSPNSQNILYLISIVPFLRGFINPAIAKFQKNLEFNKEFYLRTTVFVFDAFISIYAAFVIKNASSLALGLIAGVILELILSWILIKPIPKLKFESKKLIIIVRRGKWITLSGIFNYLFGQGDDIVVGKILNSYYLGLYQVAYKISTLPVYEGAEAILKVTFPVYVRIAEDKERLKRAYWKTVWVNIILFVPFGIFLFIFAETIVKIVLGNGWLEIIPVMRILTIYGVIRVISGTSSAVFLSLKKQKYTAQIFFIGIICMIITIIPFINKFHLIGVGYSVLLSWIVTIPFTIYFIRKVFSEK